MGLDALETKEVSILVLGPSLCRLVLGAYLSPYPSSNKYFMPSCDATCSNGPSSWPSANVITPCRVPSPPRPRILTPNPPSASTSFSPNITHVPTCSNHRPSSLLRSTRPSEIASALSLRWRSSCLEILERMCVGCRLREYVFFSWLRSRVRR